MGQHLGSEVVLLRPRFSESDCIAGVRAKAVKASACRRGLLCAFLWARFCPSSPSSSSPRPRGHRNRLSFLTAARGDSFTLQRTTRHGPHDTDHTKRPKPQHPEGGIRHRNENDEHDNDNHAQQRRPQVEMEEEKKEQNTVHYKTIEKNEGHGVKRRNWMKGAHGGAEAGTVIVSHAKAQIPIQLGPNSSRCRCFAASKQNTFL